MINRQPETTTHKWGDQIQTGDVLHVMGADYSVTQITPYGPSNLDFVDERWRVAHSGEWEMILDPDAGWWQIETGAWATSHRRKVASTDNLRSTR